MFEKHTLNLLILIVKMLMSNQNRVSGCKYEYFSEYEQLIKVQKYIEDEL